MLGSIKTDNLQTIVMFVGAVFHSQCAEKMLLKLFRFSGDKSKLRNLRSTQFGPKFQLKSGLDFAPINRPNAYKTGLHN